MDGKLKGMITEIQDFIINLHEEFELFATNIKKDLDKTVEKNVQEAVVSVVDDLVKKSLQKEMMNKEEFLAPFLNEYLDKQVKKNKYLIELEKNSENQSIKEAHEKIEAIKHENKQLKDELDQIKKDLSLLAAGKIEKSEKSEVTQNEAIPALSKTVNITKLAESTRTPVVINITL